jgi:mono/diheme cytochrome c family protein
MARATRRALCELPDDLLKDVGLTRSDIAFIANAEPTRDAFDRRIRATPRDSATAWRRPRGVLYVALVTAVVGAASAVPRAALAQDAQTARGQYLVTLGGCTDCHTPGYFFGKPDAARFLGGSEVGFEIPGLGVFHGPNLTPDQETGLGTWSAEQIGKAITAGQRPDGRVLAPIMPWHAFAKLTGEDVRAIVAFLKSLPPVKNKVPGPLGPSEVPTSFVMKVVPPGVAAAGNPIAK